MMTPGGNPIANVMTSAPSAPQTAPAPGPTMHQQIPQFGVASTNFGPIQSSPNLAPPQVAATAQTPAYPPPSYQPQQPQQPSWQQMQQFFQQMQQAYGQPQQQGAQGYAARMQAMQQNPMQNLARPVAYQPQPMPTPQPAQRYAPTAPAAQVHVGNPVQAGMQAQASGGAGLAMSDATQKVIAEPSLADSFLEHMRPYSYRYKDPRMEPRVAPTGGIYLGVMAQDLEKIPHLGSQLVVQTPQGKMVDQKTALSATMAGLARVFERVKALESDAMNRRK